MQLVDWLASQLARKGNEHIYLIPTTTPKSVSSVLLMYLWKSKLLPSDKWTCTLTPIRGVRELVNCGQYWLIILWRGDVVVNAYRYKSMTKSEIVRSRNGVMELPQEIGWPSKESLITPILNMSSPECCLVDKLEPSRI